MKWSLLSRFVLLLALLLIWTGYVLWRGWNPLSIIFAIVGALVGSVAVRLAPRIKRLFYSETDKVESDSSR